MQAQRQFEQALGDQRHGDFGAGAGEQAGQQTQGEEFAPQAFGQVGTLGAQGAQQDSLLLAGVEAGQQRGDDDGHAGGEQESQQQLDGADDLGEHRFEVGDEPVQCEHGDAGEQLDEARQYAGRIGGHVEAGDGTGGQGIELAGGEEDEEDRLHRVPYHAANAGDAGGERLVADPETEPVAEGQMQAFGHARFNRDFGDAAVAMPVSGEYGDVGGQGGGPSQVEFAPQAVGLESLRRQGGRDGDIILGGEAAADHGIERRGLEMVL